MKKSILIIGGYGEVGNYVVNELITLTSEKILIGGRNKNKAEQFVMSKNNNFLSTFIIDIYEQSTYQGNLNDIGVVIMCLNPTNSNFAQYCLSQKIHYIDISPSNQITSELMKLDVQCKGTKTLCILGVGITPGLSTLLVKEISSKLESTIKTNMSLMLGLGEEHGADGVKWLLDNLLHNFYWYQKNRYILKKPFIQKNKIDLPYPLKKNSSFAFNLSDQQIITDTLHQDNVSTYLCYNSKVFTGLMHIYAKLGIFKLLKYSAFYKIIFSITQPLLRIARRFYSDIYAIHVEVSGVQSGEKTLYSGSIVGNNNAKLTGAITAYTAFRIIDGLNKSGVYYLNQLLDLKDIEKQYGNMFTIKFDKQA